MRLWSIHPRYLDPPGLGAQWREALLAQRIVQGRTAAYRNHPQVRKVLDQEDPWAAIHDYLVGIWEEGRRRGYRYDRSRIEHHAGRCLMDVPRGQLEYEMALLRWKLGRRNIRYMACLPPLDEVEPHPSVRAVDGGIAPWERPKEEALRLLERCREGYL